MSQLKIAIIVQRYGTQVNGGAEVHARMIAEKLNDVYDVTVLTSRAVDYHTWEPVLPEGLCDENGIKVIRFDHPPKKNPKALHLLSRKLRGRRWYQKLHRFLGRPDWYVRFFPQVVVNAQEQNKFFELQGPLLYQLPEYLHQNRSVYHCFIFFTYLYYPTAIGMPVVGDKSIFIPTIHDEPPAYFPMFQKIIPTARWIFFNTRSEMKFSEKLFDLNHTQKAIVAVGLEMEESPVDPAVLQQYAITGKYLIYVGRIDEAKGCRILLDYFIRYVKDHDPTIQLVMVGGLYMNKTIHDRIIYTEFVPEQDKIQLMKQAAALVVPSKYESLSLVLLESFSYKVPVIVNGNCEVLYDHISDSRGGWVYSDYSTFHHAVEEAIVDIVQNRQAGERGYDYARAHYNWQKVLHQFHAAITDIHEAV